MPFPSSYAVASRSRCRRARSRPGAARGLALAGLLLVLPIAAPALTSVSNLSEAHGLYDVHNVSNSQWFAGGFTTGADPSVLTAVTLSIAGTGSPGNTFAVAIYGDDGSGRPGSPLAGGALSGSTGPYNGLFTYSGSVDLAAGTQYWAVASASNGYYGWFRTSSNAETSPVGWTIANWSAFNSGSGSSWRTAGSSVLFSVEIVPEPSTALLVAVGLAAVAFGRRRA